MLNPKDILDFWFGELDANGLAAPDKMHSWFAVDKSFDQLLRRRFLSYLTLASENALPEWEESAQGRLALILLLDQFSRNMFRGTAMAFANDGLARQLCREGLRLGQDVWLPEIQRIFFYLPLEHSERLEDQQESVALISQLRAATQGPLRDYLSSSLRYAEEHHEIIRRYGRFPHRNKVLSRVSTEAEAAYLADQKRGFGQ